MSTAESLAGLEVNLGGKPINGSAEVSETEVRDTVAKRVAEIGAFLSGDMPDEARADFVDELFTNQTLRLATMQTRRDLEVPLSGLVSSVEGEFCGFLAYCPGSDYVAGIEFRLGMDRERADYIERTRAALEELYLEGGSEDIAIENAWRLYHNELVLSGISPSDYGDGNNPLGMFLGALTATGEAERGSYTDQPPDFLPFLLEPSIQI